MARPDNDVSPTSWASSEDPGKLGEDLPKIYSELKLLAAHFLRREGGRGSLATTELVHEAYMRLFKGEEISFANRKHFFTCAGVAMRRILVERARRRNSAKRIPGHLLEPLEDPLEGEAPPDDEVLALDLALNGLARISPRQAQLIELRYFAGLSEQEAGQVTGVSRITVARDVRRAKRWLKREMLAESSAQAQ